MTIDVGETGRRGEEYGSYELYSDSYILTCNVGIQFCIINKIYFFVGSKFNPINIMIIITTARVRFKPQLLLRSFAMCPYPWPPSINSSLQVCISSSVFDSEHPIIEKLIYFHDHALIIIVIVLTIKWFERLSLLLVK